MYKKMIAASVLLAVLNGCSDEEAQTLAPLKVLPELDIAQVAQEPVQQWFTYTTRLEAPKEVALMPRVSGMIETIEFQDGQRVEKGDLLVTLDARPFVARVEQLKAQQASALAALSQAKSERKRADELIKRKAISAEQAETRSTAVKQRAAELSAIVAQLKSAQLDLDFTRIYAPISGTISHAFITEGNNVNANQSVLTDIVSNGEVYAYFNVDERTWNRYFSETTVESALPARLTLSGQANKSVTGRVDFVDNAIDVNTGTLTVRAVFDSNKHPLLVGSFGRVQITTSDEQDVLLVPERAIGTDLENRFVLTMNEANVLEYRPIELGERYGKYRAVINGLESSDYIAVNGPAKVGPNTEITPRPVNLDLSSTPLTLAKLETQGQSGSSVQGQ